MLKFLKGVVFSVGCLVATGAVGLVMAGNGLEAGLGITLFVGVVLTLVVFLRTIFGADTRSNRRRSDKPYVHSEEWGPETSEFSDPHAW